MLELTSVRNFVISLTVRLIVTFWLPCYLAECLKLYSNSAPKSSVASFGPFLLGINYRWLFMYPREQEQGRCQSDANAYDRNSIID